MASSRVATRQAPNQPPLGSALSSDLRVGTRRAHVAAERDFDIDARLANREAYVDLLRRLRDFYGPLEEALEGVAGWQVLSPALDLRSRRRAALIEGDLRILGFGGRPGGLEPPVLPRLDSLARGLGCLYVLEGSALGGRIIARQAHATLGADLPVNFFSSAGRSDLRGDWSSLRAALDSFGAKEGAACRRVVMGAALETFAALGAWLGLERSPR